jgi:methyl-accepting chemotaxis protein
MYSRDMRQALGEKIVSVARTTAWYVDADLVSSLQPGDETTEVYQALKAQLWEVCRSNGMEYLYTVYQDKNGVTYFGVDSDQNEPGGIGDVAFEHESMGRAFKGETGYNSDFYTDEYGTFLSAAAPVFDAQGRVVSVVSVDYSVEDVLQMEHRLKTRILLMALLAEVLALLIAFFLAGTIVRPIKHLGVVLGEMASNEGDLTRRLAEDRKDELGDLSRQTNLMLDNIHHLIANIRALVERMNYMVGEIRAGTELSSDNVRQIVTAFENVAKGAEQQAGGTESVTGQADSIIHHLEDLQAVFAEVVQKSDDSLHNVQSGTDNLQRMNRQTYQVAEDIQKTREDVHLLAEQAAQVEAITGLIKNIAEQTNLLALNAAIEAARAGEAGKGFAVVAQEVGSLATQSKSSVQEITQLLQQIHQQTTDLQTVTDANWQLVQASTPLADAVDESFARINSSIESASTVMQTATPVLALVASSGADIFKAAGEINEIAQGNAAFAEEVAASSDESLSSLKKMVQSAQELEDISQELENLVGKFKL